MPSMNSTVCFTLLWSPSNFSIFIPPSPTPFLILSLNLSYFGHIIKKWCTVSFASLHPGHVASFMMLNRSRYPFSETCPVLNRAIHAMCIRLLRFPYIRELGLVRFGFRFVIFRFVMSRRCLAVFLLLIH